MLSLDKGRLNSRGYWVIACPIHKYGMEKHPSLNVHQIDGHFLCHACGIKGGDIAKLYSLVMNVSYKQAAKLLRAWDSI